MLYEKLLEVQQQLKVPKAQWNDYSKFYYRNMDDILQALKPLLSEHKLLLFMTDGVKEIAGKNYIEATVTLVDTENGEKISVNGYAREAEKKTGMDDAQITGTCSSYARKYALAGLFCLDNDGNDPDAMDNRGANNKQQTGKQNNPSQGNNKQPQNGQNGGKKQELSGAQISRAKAKMRAANQSEGDVKRWIKTKFGKDNLADLTYKEYEELCNALDSAATK
ncbi:MAG: ERF family protein [Peptococcaceae bacterium]|nr:ERF family protein [Peptococcaceae bacterium]